ncbi:SAP domain-containing protein [Methanobrevibacter thaueri]|uniref:SAP domain protein n=1 Tax=Methanobrevibacter thaueri TaxID=190975 RepID=A0A315XNL2_9EURY|nr:SAP domain-containing protein [Methanobrevibacter thaueri]PWB87987.1 SAP domain protein [Methanobrevibacter thaueri]
MTKKDKTSKVDEKQTNKALTAEEVSEKYTVPELKSILKENGLKVSGKKEDLVERVLPILNEDSSETSTVQVDDLTSQENDDLLSPALSMFGIDYEELPVKDKTIMGDNTTLKIYGFTQNGLSMSDFTMSMVASPDIDLKMNLPEVSYSNFEDTIFTFKDLDLSILIKTDSQSLEFSAIMDSLDIITESYYVNLKGLNLGFKSLPDNSICLDIDIDSFIYPDIDGTYINFENLSLNISIGLDGEILGITTNLPKLNLLNKNYRVDLSDLNLNITLPDLELSNLDLSILMSDFRYTNFDDVHVNMDNVNVSIEPIISDKVTVITRMDALDAAGLNSFDELFPMLDINEVNFKTPTNDLESPVTITSLMPLLDISKLGMSTIATLLSSGFDLDTYMSNLPGQFTGPSYGGAFDDPNAEASGFDLVGMFEKCDYSGLDAIKFNLTGLLDSADIDLSDFGIDASDYDFSNISLSELIDGLKDSEFVMTAMGILGKLSTIDFENLDFNGLISDFDAESFDISSLLESLNISSSDLATLIDTFSNFGDVFKNLDLSCLGAIELNLTGLLDSLGIDLSDFGIDTSGYDLSAISLAELIGLLSNLEIDMNTITTLLKLFGIELDGIDLDGLISSFDAENFDISSLLESLNLSSSDLADIIEMFTNSDIDFAGMMENLDLSCLGAIELNLTGLIISLGIDISELGIDLSDYDLSAISLAELIGLLSNLEIDMNLITSLLRLLGIELDDLDFDGLINSFDEENFDMSSLLGSLNLTDSDIDAMVDMFTKSDIDFEAIFKNCDYSTLDGMVLDLTGVAESLEIDVSEFDVDLSAITIAELAGILSDPDFDMTAITSKFDASTLGNLKLDGLVSSFDEENFDISGLLESLNLSGVDMSAMVDMFSNSDIDFAGIFENIDLSCLGAIELNLGGLIVSLGIDITDLGIDLSDYDLTAISLAELIGIFSNLEIDMNLIAAVLKLFGLELDDLDFDGLISSFDAENFDLSSLLESIDLGDLDISAIVDMFTNSDIDFAGIFENIDLSCLGAIELNLTGLIESIDMDLSELGIDLSDYDLSAISLAELIGVFSNLDFDMNTIFIMLKLFGIELDGLDLDGLINSFDEENFDLNSLLGSINIGDLDISAMVDMFTNPDMDFKEMFENIDLSSLGAIELNLTRLLDSADIDLADFGIDTSDYDLSAISLAELIDALSTSEFVMTVDAIISKLMDMDYDNLDFDGLISSFDAENFDISGLLESLNLSNFDISAIFGNFDMNGFDIAEILNSTLSMFLEKSIPESSNA